MIRGYLAVKLGIPLAALGLVFAVISTLLVGGGSLSSDETATGCGLQVAGAAQPGGGQSTMAVTAEQTASVVTIVGVVKGRGLPDRAAVIAVATAMQESSLRNIDYGDRDSLGLFQQRPSQGWGTREQILDPVYSTGRFLDSMVAVAGWETMALTEIAQQVQRSAYPDAYSKWETQAAQLVADAADAPAIDGELATPDGASACGVIPGGGGADGAVIPAGLVTVRAWPTEAATADDPTTTGRITPRLLAMVQASEAAGYTTGGITCSAVRPSNSTSYHPRGMACDVFFDSTDPTAVAQGWGYANFLVANQATLGIREVIWQGRYWSATSPTAWVEYQSDVYGCPNPAEVTGCHYDHVHVSVY